MQRNKRVSILFSALFLLMGSIGAWASSVTFPGPTIYDDAGAKVTPTSISVATVTDLDGNAIAANGAVAHFAGSNSSVVYDAATKGEAWITLTPVLAGHTFANNPPVIFCSSDSQTQQSAATSAATAATQSSSANTQATAANGKLLGNVAAQTGDAYALLGTRVPNVLPTFPTNFSLFAIDGTGKVGANNLPSVYPLGATEDTALIRLYAMTNSTPAFTAPALANAPAGTGGGSTLSANELAALDRLYAMTNNNNQLLAAAFTLFPFPSEYLSVNEIAKLTSASTAQQAGSAVTLPTTPPTGYANPGYFYAPVLDSGTTQSSSLTVTITRNGSNQPVLTWSADANATSYKVLRSTNGIAYTAIFQTGLTTYTDTVRPTGNVYYSIISVH